MASTLTYHYGDEALATILVEAQKSSRTSAVARTLENAQLENWLSRGKTADDVYGLLKLNRAEDDLLKNPLLSSWISYVTKLEKENPYELLLAKMMKNYDESTLANMLIAVKGETTAARETATATIARNLEDAQLNNWLSDGKTADDVFKILRLNTEKGDDILKSSAVSTWSSFVKGQKKDPEELLFLQLKTQYSDEDLANIIVAAKTDVNVKVYVGGLENAQMTSWLKGDKTADDIFNLLNLSKDGDKVFENPMWSYWSSYATKLDAENPDKVLFQVLKKHFGDDGLAKMIDQAKESTRTKSIGIRLEEESWMSSGKTADDVFKLLKLDQAKNNVFESPAISDWVSYANKLSKENKDEFATIVLLEDRFGDAELARMLAAAKGNSDTVSGLREMQFEQWMTLGLNPGEVGAMLTMTDTKRNARVILDFHTFYTTKS